MNSTTPDSSASSRDEDDHEIYSRILQEVALGDSRQFGALHQRYHNLVFSTAYQVLNNVHDAEDVTQEVFANAFKKGCLYHPERGSAKTWLASMTRNRAIDRLRAKQRRNKLSEEVRAETGSQESFDTEEVEKQVHLGEEAQLLRSAVMQLSPEQREVIEMTYFKGLTQSEAAQELGAPLGTVKARARRGLIRLRSIVPRMT